MHPLATTPIFPFKFTRSSSYSSSCALDFVSAKGFELCGVACFDGGRVEVTDSVFTAKPLCKSVGVLAATRVGGGDGLSVTTADRSAIQGYLSSLDSV